MLNIAGVVILYHPDDALSNRIKTYIDYIGKLYVIDNSENPEPFSYQHQKIVYLSDCINKGIAARLNQSATLALSAGFEWLLTMDQDSFFQQHSISDYINCIRKHDKKNSVAMYGVEFIRRSLESNDCNLVEVSQMITSGSIINLKLLNNIGWFDEALFIDQVDFDYCYRAILKNYRVIQFNNILLEHSLGNASIHRSLKSFNKTERSLHSPERIYYMTRNYLYMRRKYKQFFPKQILHTKKDLINRIKNNFLYGTHKAVLLKNIFKAFLDFRKNKMGKLS